MRELRNAVEGACVLAAGDVVTLADFDHLPPPSPRGARVGPRAGRAAARADRRAGPSGRPTPGDRAAAEPSVAIPLGCTLAEAERRIVLASLRHHRTRARAARALGIGLRTLYTKLAAWGAAGEDAETA